MTDMKVTVRGKDELLRRLGALAPSAEKELAAASMTSGQEMVALARSYVPVRTGALRDSIVLTPPGGTPPAFSQGTRIVPPAAVMVTAGNTRVRYSHLVEFGTRAHIAGGQFAGAEIPGAPAQPFFWPAYRLTSRRHRSRAGRALGKSIKAAK